MHLCSEQIYRSTGSNAAFFSASCFVLSTAQIADGQLNFM
jgi:hypothetical protein